MFTLSHKRRLTAGISIAAVAAALAVSMPAMAQTLSTIRGEHATPGATISVRDTTTGQTNSTKVNPDGTFAIVGLRPSTYNVTGAGEAQEVVLPVGQTVTIDAAPAAAAAGGGAGDGAIVVTGRRNRSEVRTATVTTNVSREQIENLPQNDRNFLNFAALAPGVQVSTGNKRVQAGAVSADQINVFIDGLSFKNPINHGGIAGQNFSQGNPFPQLAVQEFKVDTQNFKAEYEQAGSAIITAVTKTGGTAFHGDAFVQYQPKSFIGRPFFDRPGEANNPNGNNKKPDYKRYQYGGDLGGPIIPEKLHFFVAYEATEQDSPSTSVNLDPVLVGADLASQLNGSFPQTFEQQLYFGKLSAFITEDDTVDASAFIRKEENLADFGGIRAQSGGRLLLSNGRVYQADWKHRGENWLNQATLAYNTFENGTPLVSDGPEIVLRCRALTAGDPPVLIDPCPPGQIGNFGGDVALLGANSFEQNDLQKTYTLKDVATFERGSHIIRAGVKLTKNRFERLENSVGNASFRFNAADYTTFDTSVPFSAAINTADVRPASAKNTQIGLFIQDDWTPNDHLTINAGIRWDYETNAKNENFVTPDRIANALRSYPGWQAAGIDPEDYISTGNNRHAYKWAFQPRVGVSYDVRGDRDLIFFGGAGRYYDRPLFITAAIETIKANFSNVANVDFCNDSTFTNLQSCADVRAANGGVLPPTILPYDTAFRDVDALRGAITATGLGGDVWLLNNKTKLPYSDQFNAGVRKRFGDWQTSLTFSHIRSNNVFQFVRGNRFSNGWFSRILQRDVNGNVIGCTEGPDNVVIDDFPNQDYAACPATQGDLAGFNGKLNIGRNDGKAHYTALYFQAEKPFTRTSGWGVTASLTLQRARTNVGTELGADEFFAGPDQTQFGWQYVQGVPKWNFVGTGIVGLPFDITASTTVNLNGGPAFGNVRAGFMPGGTSLVLPENACCLANLGGVFFPNKDIAYKTVDIRLAKTFRTPWGHSITADFQAYNVFDWVNRNYSAWGAGGGDNPSLQENGTVGNARSFQAGLKYSF
jgi:hypothetical protein